MAKVSAQLWVWWPVKGHPRSHQFWRLTIGPIFFDPRQIFPEVAAILVHVYGNICQCELELRSVKRKLRDDIICGVVHFFCGAWALLRRSLPCLRFLDQTQSHTHAYDRILWRSSCLVAVATIYTSQEKSIYACSGSWSHNYSIQVAADLPLRLHSHKGQWGDIRMIVSRDRPSIRAWIFGALLTLEAKIY